MAYYIMRPCRTAVGYIATPRRRARINLKQSGEVLRRAGFDVMDVNVLLMLKGEPEITLYESGKVLVKTNDEVKARAAAESVFRTLGLDGTNPSGR
jgi:hypothetical protein